MESVLKRHLNLIVLAGVLLAQIIGLAAQVKRPGEAGSVRLIRLWAVSALTPFERAVFGTGRAVRGAWNEYIDLRGVRSQNDELRAEVQRLRLEQLRISEDTAQARRLQALLGFKEKFVSDTLPAQVISTTGSEFSRGIYIDKGSRDGVKPDMPVITPDGIVGKVYRVYPTSSLVLEINDPSSGAGVILQQSRLQGVVKGTPDGEVTVRNIMADEGVQAGERVLTSGGDRVFPKGLPVGTVTRVSPSGTFLSITVRPAAQLDKIEEVLVVTRIDEHVPATDEAGEPLRAADILANRLPSVPPAPALPGSTPAEVAAAAANAAKTPSSTATPNAGVKPPASAGQQAPPNAAAVVKPETKAAEKTKPGEPKADKPKQEPAPEPHNDPTKGHRL